MSVTNEKHARKMLREIGDSVDDGFDLLTGAFYFAALNRPSIIFEEYTDHMSQLACAAATPSILRSMSAENAARHLKEIIAVKYCYTGDLETYDDLQNADLFRVIDRRRGLPVALGIIYIHIGRRLGWKMRGLSFPGHFLVQLEIKGQRVIIDPFTDGRILDPSDLRGMVKTISGFDRELRPHDYTPISDRAILLRLQNNVKFRHMQMRNGVAALKTVEEMLLIAPKMSDLWWDAAMLNAEMENLSAAYSALENFIRSDESKINRLRAVTLMEQIKTRMN
ncbi:MAG: hypothetical protein CMM41_08080 [Rhodospirillaceae bacterium]|nr:hypothetical protein [Rhodospirillaceae bacterium]